MGEPCPRPGGARPGTLNVAPSAKTPLPAPPTGSAGQDGSASLGEHPPPTTSSDTAAP